MSENATGGLDPTPPDPGAKHTGGLDPYPPNPGVLGWQKHIILAVALLGVALIGERASMLFIASGTALAVSSWLAMSLAARDTRQRLAAAALLLMLAAMLLRGLLGTTVLTALGPYAGLHRVAFHVDQALYIGSALVPAWLAARVFWPTERRQTNVIAAFMWAGAVLVVVAGYPELRGDALRRFYLLAELASLLVAVGACAAWVRRRMSPSRAGADFARGMAESFAAGVDGSAAPSSPHPRWYTVSVVLMLIIGDLALLGVGAWRHGLFGQAYALQQAGLLALYLSVAGVQAVALALRRRK